MSRAGHIKIIADEDISLTADQINIRSQYISVLDNSIPHYSRSARGPVSASKDTQPMAAYAVVSAGGILAAVDA